MSFSLNKKDINLELENQEKILLIIRKYFTDKRQDRLKEIL